MQNQVANSGQASTIYQHYRKFHGLHNCRLRQVQEKPEIHAQRETGAEDKVAMIVVV